MKQIAYNRTKRTSKAIYLVIHTTGNTNRGANADAHFTYWNGGNRGSSADFVVDSSKALQINDYTKYYTWHCGDGKGKYGITNANSIGIEICINSDGDFNKAVDNTVKLVKQLMRDLNIPIENVVRHWDASRKNCPAQMSENNWEEWHKFKKRLQEKIETPEDIISALSKSIEILDKNSALKAVSEEKKKNSSLYWILYKIVNK